MYSEKLQDKIIEAVEKITPSLAVINSYKLERSYPTGSLPVSGQGSGFVISEDGLLVTNFHVVEGSGKVHVIMGDGSTYDGYIIGSDPPTDIAVVKIDSNRLTRVEFEDSDKLKVGQFVLAIGNALGLPGGPTVSLGVLSAANRPLPGSDFIFEGLLQTDAAVNPGNSGGPLLNIEGKVIGMNTAMIPFAQGVGFAIPSNTIKRISKELIQHERVSRPWIGVSGVELNSSIARRFSIGIEYGFLVLEVVKGSPAEYAGVMYGDVIIGVNNKRIEKTRDLISALSNSKYRAELALLRKGKIINTTVFPIEQEIAQ